MSPKSLTISTVKQIKKNPEYIGTIEHKLFADTQEKLDEDYEVQGWVNEMATSQSHGGCGIGGMPEKLENTKQLVDVCTAIISTCSLGHAGANFQQYEAYGFVPNYPPVLLKMPPQNKVFFYSPCCKQKILLEINLWKYV